MNNKQKHHMTLKKMILTAICLAAFLFLLFAGCSDSAFSPLNPSDDGSPPSGGNGSTLGLMEITVSGIGSGAMEATARPPAPRAAADISGLPAGNRTDGSIQLKSISYGSFIVGQRGAGAKGYRYFYATFKVRNADSDGTPYQSRLNNLTFLAVDTKTGTYGRTAVSEMSLFNGTRLTGSDAVALAGQVIPTGRVAHIPGEPDGMRLVRTDVLQVFTESEAGNFESGLSGSNINDIFPYGFVVRTPKVTPGSRTLPNLKNDGRSGTDQFDGLVTFAFKIPLQAQSNMDPYKILFCFWRWKTVKHALRKARKPARHRR